jgi:hypothetical protein
MRFTLNFDVGRQHSGHGPRLVDQHQALERRRWGARMETVQAGKGRQLGDPDGDVIKTMVIRPGQHGDAGATP